jgi:hypothetical protein
LRVVTQRAESSVQRPAKRRATIVDHDAQLRPVQFWRTAPRRRVGTRRAAEV